MSRIVVLAAVGLLALQGCGGSAPEPQPEPAVPKPFLVHESSPAPAATPEPTPIPAAMPLSPPPGPSETELAAMRERVVTTPKPEASAPDPAGVQPKPAADPLKEMFEAEARRKEQQQQLGALAAELEAAKALIAQREREVLAFKNPFLPRPALTSEEASSIGSMDGVQRVAWAESKVTEARVAVEKLQKKYDDAKAAIR